MLVHPSVGIKVKNNTIKINYCWELVSMPTKAFSVLRFGRIRASFAAVLLLSTPSQAFLRQLSSFPTVLSNLQARLDSSQLIMVSTRSRISTMAASSLPLTVLSATKLVSQEKKKSSSTVTPSPSRKRRRISKTESSPKTTGSTTKKELNFAPSLTSGLVASINPDQHYIDLGVPPAELRPSATLTTGQCFHWKAVEAIAKDEDGTIKKESAWGTHNASKLQLVELNQAAIESMF